MLYEVITFGAFCEELGMDFETAMRLSSSFGGGMGRLREVCGAVSGMFMVAGLKYGYSSPTDSEAKANRITSYNVCYTKLLRHL